MRDAAMAASILPSADTAVRACMDAVPVSLDDVAVLIDRQNLYALERQEMLDSRRAKNDGPLLTQGASRGRARVICGKSGWPAALHGPGFASTPA